MNTPQFASRQGGFSLIMVLAMMMIIALMVVAGAQTGSTELRMAANTADARYAFSIAEKALLAGEQEATNLVYSDDTNVNAESVVEGKFPASTAAACAAGLCPYNKNDATVARTLPWADEATWDKTKNRCKAADVVNTTDVAELPCYVIEYLGPDKVDGGDKQRVMRVTARAWGKNAGTTAMVQSVILLPSSD